MNKISKLPPRAAALVLATVSCLGLSACMTTTPVWDGQRGVALAAVNQMQIINPDAPAGLRRSPVLTARPQWPRCGTLIAR